MRSAAGQAVVFFGVLGVVALVVGLGAAESTTEQCRTAIQPMRSCLPYATAKATSPTADCCTVVKKTVQNNKDCLCQFIALVHKGSPEVNSLGVQEAKLIQLPSACNLKNVSTSMCPKLAPSSSPIASNATSGGVGYKPHAMLRLEALVLVALIAFLFPFPDRLLFHVFV